MFRPKYFVADSFTDAKSKLTFVMHNDQSIITYTNKHLISTSLFKGLGFNNSKAISSQVQSVHATCWNFGQLSSSWSTCSRRQMLIAFEKPITYSLMCSFLGQVSNLEEALKKMELSFRDRKIMEPKLKFKWKWKL